MVRIYGARFGLYEKQQHTEGSVVNNSGVYTYEYVLRDHLGNTRVTFNANSTGILVVSDIKQINSYYPFGLNMEGPGFGAGGANKYQYNGIELNTDFGLNINTAFFRGYDPAVGRWWQVDPKPNYGESMYSGMGNNPVRYNDMLGDTIRGNNEQSAQRLLNILFRTFARETPGGMSMASLFKLGNDGKTFSSIKRGDFRRATQGLTKEQKQLAKGYMNAVNDNVVHAVEVAKRGGKISENSRGNVESYQGDGGFKSIIAADDAMGGGFSNNYLWDGNIAKTDGSNTYSLIVLDSKSGYTPEELSAHEVIGHGGNKGMNTSENAINAIQTSNIFYKAMGINKSRGFDATHSDPSGQSNRHGTPPNMALDIWEQ